MTRSDHARASVIAERAPYRSLGHYENKLGVELLYGVAMFWIVFWNVSVLSTTRWQGEITCRQTFLQIASHGQYINKRGVITFDRNNAISTTKRQGHITFERTLLPIARSVTSLAQYVNKVGFVFLRIITVLSTARTENYVRAFRQNGIPRVQLLLASAYLVISFNHRRHKIRLQSFAPLRCAKENFLLCILLCNDVYGGHVYSFASLRRRSVCNRRKFHSIRNQACIKWSRWLHRG